VLHCGALVDLGSDLTRRNFAPQCGQTFRSATVGIISEDNEKFLFPPGADKQQRWPRTLNGVFIEKFDAAQGDRAGAAGPFFDVLPYRK
jgi:hypothetical protein